MPFRLCYALATFQRYMAFVFHELIEDSMEVFMDDLSVFEFDIEIRDKKGAENLTADHLSRLENPNLGKLAKAEIRDLFPKERLMVVSDNDNEPTGKNETTAWNKFSSTMAFVVICLATNQKFNFSKYMFDNMVKNLEGGVKFLMYPRFLQVFLDKQVEGMSKHKEIYVTPSHTKKVFANMKRQGKDFFGKDTSLFPTMIVQAQEQIGEDIEDPQLSGPTELVTDDTKNVASVRIHSNDLLLNGEDRLKLTELMELFTKLSERVLAMETTKTNQALEIDSLKRRVKKLEKKKGLRTYRLRIVYKVGRSARVVSSEDEGLGAQEDASKQRRKIDEIDQDVEVTLVDETQGRYGDNLMFDTGVLDNEQDMAEKEVDMVEKDVSIVNPVTTAGEVVTTANVVTLIEIKAAKPKAVTTTATTTTTVVTRPKAREVVVQEPKERLARQKEEDANISKWDNIQPMIDADYELAARLQSQEQEELTIEERSKMFVELMDKRKKHFARLRAKEQRRKPLTKAQKRNTMVNTFVEMDTELVKGSETRTKGSSKRAGEELESKNLKKQKLDENVEAEVDDDQEEAKMKKHMEIVPDDEVAIDAIPLAIKPPIIGLFILGMERGAAQISNTVNDVGKDHDGVNSSPTTVTLGNLAVNKEDTLHDENDGLTPSKSTGNLNKGTSYANLFTGGPSRKAMNFRTLFTLRGNRADVVVPVESIRVISEQFANTAYGFFLGKHLCGGLGCDACKWSMVYSQQSTYSKKVDSRCELIERRFRSTNARALIKVRADVELKDNIVVAMLKLVGEGFYTCNVHVEYK
ncbi:hypothetical protein Tco_0553803 [Tanacetum coccineum]